MKKNLILLTGIVFLITVLVACGGRTGNEQQEQEAEEVTPKESTEAANTIRAAPKDTTTVEIYLKDRLINDTMHLEMYDSKKPGCPVIDNLETFVNAGDTIIFKKAQHSKVRKVTDIRIEYDVEIISLEDFDFKGDKGLYVLVVNPTAPKDTILVKYDIEFTVKDKTNVIGKDSIFTIDPYLKIPKQL